MNKIFWQGIRTDVIYICPDFLMHPQRVSYPWQQPKLWFSKVFKAVVDEGCASLKAYLL